MKPKSPYPPGTWPWKPGAPFTAIEFEGMTVTPYVDTGRCQGKGKGGARQGYSLKATGVRAPPRGTARQHAVAQHRTESRWRAPVGCHPCGIAFASLRQGCGGGLVGVGEQLAGLVLDLVISCRSVAASSPVISAVSSA